MFEEKDDNGQEDDSYIVNLHTGSKDLSPYEWLLDNKRGKYTLENKKIKFFFCPKHENTGKIESHLWFFKGFCAYTNPLYCQMIDAGTVPLKNSIAKIVKYMEVHDNIGGACGEIEVFEPSDKELGYGVQPDGTVRKRNI